MAPRRRSLNAKYDSVASTYRVRPLSFLVGGAGGGGGGAQNLAARQKRADERAAFLQRLGIDQAQLAPAVVLGKHNSNHNNNNNTPSRLPSSFNALQNRNSGHTVQGTRSAYPVYDPHTADENRPEQWVLDIMYPHEACPPAPERVVPVPPPPQQQSAPPMFISPPQVAQFAPMWPSTTGTTTTTTPSGSSPYVPLWLTPHGVVDMAGRPLHLPPGPNFTAPHVYCPEPNNRYTPSPPHRHTKRSRYAAYSPDFDDDNERYDDRYEKRYYSLLKRRRRPRYSPTESELEEEEYRRRRRQRRRLRDFIDVDDDERASDGDEGAFMEEFKHNKVAERGSAHAAFLQDVAGDDETSWRDEHEPSFDETTHSAPLRHVAARSASPPGSPTPWPTPPRPQTLPDPTPPANSSRQDEYVDDRSGIRGARLVHNLERAAEDWSNSPSDDEAAYEVGGSTRRQQKVRSSRDPSLTAQVNEVCLPTPPTSSLPPSSASRLPPKSARPKLSPNNTAEWATPKTGRQKQHATSRSADGSSSCIPTPSSTVATPRRLHRVSERAWTAFEGIRTAPTERVRGQRTPPAYDVENSMEAAEGDACEGDNAFADADAGNDRDDDDGADAESIAQFSDEAHDDRAFWAAACAVERRADMHAYEGEEEIEPAHPRTPSPPPQLQTPAPKARKEVRFDLAWDIGAEGDGYPGFKIWRDGWD